MTPGRERQLGSESRAPTPAALPALRPDHQAASKLAAGRALQEEIEQIAGLQIDDVRRPAAE